MGIRQSRLKLTDLEQRILLHLRITGPTPRIQLGAALGASGATITRATRQLIGLDLVHEDELPEERARGRPTIPLAIKPQGAWAVGATVQPGWLEIGIVDFSGRPLLHDSLPFESPDPVVFARTLDQRLRELVAMHGFLRGRFLGLGVAVAGYARDGDRNRRVAVSRLSGWRDVPLAETLGDILDMPIWIENDATAAALAEYYQPGIIDRYRSILVLFLGHGIGGGVVAARDLFHGDYGNAGEIGKLFPGPTNRPSGIDLIATFEAAGIRIGSLVDVEPLMDRYPTIIETWIERVARQLEAAIIGGVAWIDPGAVVVSGALPIPLLHRLADRVRMLNAPRHANYLAPVPEILASPLGSRAVAIGAAMAPIHAVTARESSAAALPI